MKRFQNLVLIVVGTTAIVAAGPYIGSSAAHATEGALQEATDVRVVNREDEPVPIFGRVVAELADRPAGNPLTVAGEMKVVNDRMDPAMVAVTNSPSVENPWPIQIVNDHDDPVKVCVETCNPFNGTKHVLVGAGGYEADALIGVVPAGRRLVIENVSARAILSGTQYVTEAYLYTTVNGVTAYHYLTIARIGVNVSIWQAGAQCKIYADAGTEVGIVVSRSGGTSDMTLTGTIAGSEMPMP